jgi:lipid-A-disaccharide synthase
MRIGISAGEASGDLLAAGLMRAIRTKVEARRAAASEQERAEEDRRNPLRIAVTFEGIAGPRMMETGCRALFTTDQLAVMGITEVLGKLRELLRIRRVLAQHFIADPPEVFVGVDAPDFNLGLELKLRKRGIRTAHFVSPSVWAWRQYRIKKIKRATDLMLCVFPFEEEFYREHGGRALYVGHPLADDIPMEVDVDAARARLNLPRGREIVAILPGSRGMEVNNLGAEFVRTARWLAERRTGLHFVTPLVNAKTRATFEQALAQGGADLPFTLLDGKSHDAMAAADVVLLASGTAALEAMLLKKPMVVAYRVSKLSEVILRRMIRVPFYSLPNLLAGEKLVAEYVQDEVRADYLGQNLLSYLAEPDRARALKARFTELHWQLRRNAADRAAQAILELMRR